MAGTTYKIWGWGNPVGRGVMGAVHVGIAGVAKPATTEQPYAIANEMICGELGRALRLPVPPNFVVVRESDGIQHHVSLNFALSGENLPPADPASVTAHQPALACGVVLFDLWVANYDRHAENLAYDEDKNALQLFDHGHAFMGGTEGRARLEEVDDLDLINGSCLTAQMTLPDAFVEWSNRINSLPEFQIADIVRDANAFGLPGDDVSFCTEYLLERRRGLLDIVKNHRELFVNVEPDRWTTVAA